LTDGSYYRKADSLTGACNEMQPAPLVRTSAKSAELIKHASNAFLAMKISFINSVANVCEAVEADVEEVARGMGLDRRIGPRFLNAGLGYGGSCFPKDLKAFYAISQQVGATFDLLKEVERVNERQQKLFLKKIRSTLWNLRRKRLAVLGLAFKGGTDDIRESPAINLVRCFLAEGCSIAAYDPAAADNARRLFSNEDIAFADDPYEAMEDADALVVLTDWPEFARLDLTRVKACLANPVIFDGRNLFDCKDMVKEGLTYICMGRPATEDCGELLQTVRRAS
jgi:UDPglucose 6-dehydrogenase